MATRSFTAKPMFTCQHSSVTADNGRICGSLGNMKRSYFNMLLYIKKELIQLNQIISNNLNVWKLDLNEVCWVLFLFLWLRRINLPTTSGLKQQTERQSAAEHQLSNLLFCCCLAFIPPASGSSSRFYQHFLISPFFSPFSSSAAPCSSSSSSSLRSAGAG